MKLLPCGIGSLPLTASTSEEHAISWDGILQGNGLVIQGCEVKPTQAGRVGEDVDFHDRPVGHLFRVPDAIER